MLKRFSAPLIVVIAIAINVLVYCISPWLPGLSSHWILGAGASFATEWPKLLTYSFVHSGFFHLLFNMLVLWWAGSVLVRLSGAWTFVDVWLAGALTGGIGFLMVSASDAGSAMTLCGASAAVLGVVGGLWSVLRDRKITLPNFLEIIGIKNRAKIVITFKGRYLLLGILAIALISNPLPAALATHCCGFAAGVVLSMLPRIINKLHDRLSETGQNDISKDAPLSDSASESSIIIEKMRRSGYSSLTDDERRHLSDQHS